MAIAIWCFSERSRSAFFTWPGSCASRQEREFTAAMAILKYVFQRSSAGFTQCLMPSLEASGAQFDELELRPEEGINNTGAANIAVTSSGEARVAWLDHVHDSSLFQHKPVNDRVVDRELLMSIAVKKELKIHA